MDTDTEQLRPERYRAQDLERLIAAHKAEYPRVDLWRMPRHTRADNRAWLQVDGPRGPVHRSLPRRWKEPEPLEATVDDLEDGTARWVQLGWRASYSGFEWTYTRDEGWRDQNDDGDEAPDWVSELQLESTPRGVLEFMRDLDTRVVALGRRSDLDLMLAAT